MALFPDTMNKIREYQIPTTLIRISYITCITCKYTHSNIEPSDILSNINRYKLSFKFLDFVQNNIQKLDQKLKSKNKNRLKAESKEETDENWLHNKLKQTQFKDMDA
eukprot:83035_1